MLNRTNRTLSANTHRLNLGTRKLDQLASDNNGSLTLRTAHAHLAVTVRTGVTEYPGFPMEGPPIPAEPKRLKPAMPMTSGSSARPMKPAQGFWAWDQGLAAAMSSRPDQPAGVIRYVVGSVGSATPPVSSSSRSQSRSSLGWPCDQVRLASRSARAALALVTEASP